MYSLVYFERLCIIRREYEERGGIKWECPLVFVKPIATAPFLSVGESHLSEGRFNWSKWKKPMWSAWCFFWHWPSQILLRNITRVHFSQGLWNWIGFCAVYWNALKCLLVFYTFERFLQRKPPISFDVLSFWRTFNAIWRFIEFPVAEPAVNKVRALSFITFETWASQVSIMWDQHAFINCPVIAAEKYSMG